MSGLHHLGCEACGSTLGVRDGQRLVRCVHCGADYVALVPGFIPRFSVSPQIDATEAQAVARKTLEHAEVDRSLKKEAKLGPAELYWVPFYEVDGLQVSTYVEKERNRTDTRLAFVDFQAQGCAQELEAWGLADLRPRAERQRARVPLAPALGEQLAKQGQVLAVPPIPSSALTPNEPVAAKREIVASGSALLGTERRYVYHPIWRIEVRDRHHPYWLTVDGVSGALLAGRLPQDRRSASLWLLLTLALFGLLLGRTLRVSLSLDELVVLLRMWPLVLTVAGLILSTLFIALAVFWSETRFRGEVCFSRASTRVEKLGRPAETKLERWAIEVAARVERLLEATFQAR